MARNKLSDLNDHLFAALERLNEEDLTTETIKDECERVNGIIGLSTQIISNAKIIFEAMKLVADGRMDMTELPESFGFQKANTLKINT